MWYAQEDKKAFQDLNQEFLKIKGNLEGKEARITLAKFLRANLGITTELISGIKLAPFQEIMLKGMLKSVLPRMSKNIQTKTVGKRRTNLKNVANRL